MVHVYRIEDPSVPAKFSASFFSFIPTDESTTAGQLKRSVEAKTGVPPGRQRLYGCSHYCRSRYCFNTTEILRDDDEIVRRTLKDLMRRGRITYTLIGVLTLPAAEGDSDEPQVVREVTEEEAIERRIAAGRPNAIVVGDSDDSGSNADDDEDDEAPSPPPKRQRTVEHDERGADANEDGGGGDGDEEAGDPNVGRDGSDGSDAAQRDRNGADENEDEDDEEVANDNGTANGGDEDGDGGAVNGSEAAAANPGAAAEAAAVASAGPDAGEPPLPSIRQWLRDLDANGSDTGRFERYAPAFEREFHSPAALALVPEEGEDGWKGLFQCCGVESFGDKLWLKRAVRSLPRPE